VEIRDHDAELAACFREIRSTWPPGDVIICHRFESFYWGFAQFAYYLPEYRNVLLAAKAALLGGAGTRAWVGYRHETAFESQYEPPDGQQLVLIVPPGESVDLFQQYFDVRKATLMMDAGVRLYQLHP
jgi:hypothetical protein